MSFLACASVLALRSSPWPVQAARGAEGSRRHQYASMQLECTEANVEAVLERFSQAAVSMFGCHEEASAIGITGEIHLVSIDGPFISVALNGRFWHRRETVLRNAATF